MSNFSNQIENINNKISLLKSKETYKGCLFNKPTTINRVEKFEKQNNIKLPESLILFITEVCNGATTFQDFDLFKLDDFHFFAKQNSEQELFIHPEMTDKKWNELVEELDEFTLDKYSKIEADELSYQWETKMYSGILIISDENYTYHTGIIIKGKYKGRIVVLDMSYDKPYFFEEKNILDWYESILDTEVNYIKK